MYVVQLKFASLCITAAILAVILSACGNSHNYTPNNTSPTAPWQSWIESLDNREYNVTQGSVYMVDNAACDTLIDVFNTCFGNNAAAPYLIPQLPVGDTYLDPNYAYDFNATGPDGDNSNMFFRLSENDALVTIVNLPPKAAYMGYQSYMFSRDLSHYADINVSATLTPGKERAEVFGSLGNDVNNVVVQNGGNIAWSGNAAVYITTANEELADALVADATSQGLKSSVMFIEPMGKDVIIGNSSSADDFITLIRYALPENDDLADAWKNTRDENILVYRVTKTSSGITRFETPTYSQKESVNESEYNVSLVELTSLLAEQLQTSVGLAVESTAMLTSDKVSSTGELEGLVGQDCIKNATSCLGDNQDTDAYRLGYVGLLESNHSVIITGVNHTLNDAATYISLAVYDIKGFKGVASISQTNVDVTGYDKGNLTGSAEAILKAYGIYDKASETLKAELPKLYASVVSRACETALGENCVEITQEDIPLIFPIAITQRAYVKPGSTCGANPNNLLSPYVTKIKK